MTFQSFIDWVSFRSTAFQLAKIEVSFFITNIDLLWCSIQLKKCTRSSITSPSTHSEEISSISGAMLALPLCSFLFVHKIWREHKKIFLYLQRCWNIQIEYQNPVIGMISNLFSNVKNLENVSRLIYEEVFKQIAIKFV